MVVVYVGDATFADSAWYSYSIAVAAEMLDTEQLRKHGAHLVLLGAPTGVRVAARARWRAPHATRDPVTVFEHACPTLCSAQQSQLSFLPSLLGILPTEP